MIRRLAILPSLAALILIPNPAAAAGSAGLPDDGDGTRENPYVIPRTSLSVSVDGVLDDEAWRSAFVLELKYEVQPGENIEPAARTECLLIYTDSHLLAAFRAYDPDPGAIRAFLRDRDSVWGNDFVGIVLDSLNDERTDFLLASNPLGVQLDTIEINYPEESVEWDAIWDSAGRIYDWGYAVEMAVPFDQLRFQRTEGDQVWGFDAIRNYPRSVSHFMGAFPRDRNNNCYLCQSIKIKGFAGADPGRNLEIVPTLTAVRSDARDALPGGEFRRQTQEAEAGVTANWGITPNINLGITANPDFSQVEADARQLDINQTFALYYTEMRPFFTEGADYFRSTMSVVHTRMMSDPQWGVKLTGKEGDNTFGAYVVRDEVTRLVIPALQGSSTTTLPGKNYSSVFRFKRDIGNKYTLGAIFTDREGDDYFNRVYGFDGRFRITDRDRVSVQVLGSSTRYPGAVAAAFGQPTGSFNGTAFAFDYYHDARDLSWVVRYWGIGEDYRNDLGRNRAVGYRWLSGWMNYYWYAEPGQWWTRINAGGGFDYTVDNDSNLLYRTQNCWFSIDGAMQSNISLRAMFNLREVYEGQEFDNSGFRASARIRPIQEVNLAGSFFIGNDVDYANARQADRVSFNPSIVFNLSHLRLNFDHSFERLSVGAGRLYTANISQAWITYQFDRRTFIRAILQYVDYRRNAELYTFEIDPVFQSFFTQLLFSYKINPRTVLFVGYSDNYFGSQDYSLTQSDRTFFVKLGYAWTL